MTRDRQGIRAATSLYLAACRAVNVTSEARRDLPRGSSRAKVTSANAKWSACCEHRDRIADNLRAEGLGDLVAAIDRLAGVERDSEVGR